MGVDPSSAASTSLAFVVFTRQVQDPRMAMGRGGEEPRKTLEAEEPRMDTNGHEWSWAGQVLHLAAAEPRGFPGGAGKT